MAILVEADHLIETDISADVKRYEDGNGISERIIEWLETPEGTVADHPSWGHNIEGFKHDPIGPRLEVLIEMSIARKLPRDIEDIQLLGVGVESLEIDMFKILIRHQFGGTVGTLVL